MMLLRLARKSDLADIYHLAKVSGIGMTTLPKDEQLLAKRLQWSEKSFHKKIEQPENEYYFFVLEDTEKKQVVGTTAIESHLGHEVPFYSYKLSRRTRISHSLNIRSDYEVLSLVNDYQGCSEICTLYLEPEYRHGGNGLLLSKSRFLFMADFPNRFASYVIAEMRGHSDQEGHSPFWDNVGYHFFQMPFAKADQLTISTNKQFIADLMPRNPIYVKLLTEKAQNVIGKPHPSTLPAMKILLKEGFRYEEYIDIFDAGPTIGANVADIKTITASLLLTVNNVHEVASNQQYLISNNQLDFRATAAQVIINKQKKTAIICEKTADLLNIKTGDTIRVSPLKIRSGNE